MTFTPWIRKFFVRQDQIKDLIDTFICKPLPCSICPHHFNSEIGDMQGHIAINNRHEALQVIKSAKEVLYDMRIKALQKEFTKLSIKFNCKEEEPDADSEVSELPIGDPVDDGEPDVRELSGLLEDILPSGEEDSFGGRVSKGYDINDE